MKPLIHFAHANGVPSKVYQKLFALLQDDFDIIYVLCWGRISAIQLIIIGKPDAGDGQHCAPAKAEVIASPFAGFRADISGSLKAP
jgi:hypothetical protein